ncbi:50S ribosomal protein L6 [Nitrosotalea sinensis]|uniref:50S ribosomal protein L6 n=1 Tax=Nitrosotalea sinensis TaxID=1499975 RepID=A0A2H1EJ42_9ARCH|nr:50S ribosomal protein L6 [Candidatus Nitrosotalea sinensis]SHO46833.1 50S ribosomal protein L6 [Candidatus Nitrosotalea sinensis]
MSTKEVELHQVTIPIPDSVKASVTHKILHVQGPLGKTRKAFKKIPVDLQIEGKNVVLKSVGVRKRDYAIFKTAESIINTLFKGVQTGYTFKMKVVYAHFPITVKIKDGYIHVENFQGERAARTSKIFGETKVVSKGDDIIITGPVLTDVSQTAGSLQQNTKVKNKDHRVFLDGVYLFEKLDKIEK